MSEYKIAIKIAGQLESSFNRAINGAQKELTALGGMSRVGSALGKAIGGSVKLAGTALTATGAALAGVGVASTKVGSDFEAAMSSAAATAGATEEEYAKLEAAALEMGRTTSKTASESANALEYMALAGWDVDTSVAALPGVLRLSEASGMDLARCSDLVTDSMAALGVQVGENGEGLANYMDVITRAQNKSNQTSEQLMEAYIGVGGVMKNLGVPITESATALGVMANRGIKGSEAGTALNAIMTNLTTGMGQAGDMMESLGISAFDQEGNFIGLEATLQELNHAMEGMTDEERNATLAAIGGKHHVDALNALMSGLNDTTDEGISEWAALSSELENAEGALDEMRKMKMDNLAGDMKTLGSAAEYAGIQIYKNLQDPLRNLTQYGTEQLNRLSDALVEGGFTGLASEIGPMLAENLQLAVEGLPDAISEVRGVSDAFFEGIIGNADSIGESVAELASAAVQGFMNWYGNFYSAALYLVNGFMLGMTGQISNITDTFGAMIAQMDGAVNDNLPTIIDSAASIISGLIDGLTENMPALLDFSTDIVTNIAAGIKEHASEIAGSAVDLIGAIGQGIIDNAGEWANAGLDILEGLATAISDNLPTLLDTASDIVDQIGTGLDEALTEGSPFLTRAGEIITKIGSSLVENAPKLIETGIRLLGELAKGVLKGAALIIQNLPAILNGIIDVVSSIDWVGLGMEIMEGIIEGIKALGSAVISAAKEIFTEMMHFGEDDTTYNSGDITGYTQTTNGMYTNDNGENYYSLEDLVGQGNAEAIAIQAQMAEAGAAAGEAYGEGLESTTEATAAAAKENAKAGFDGLKIDESAVGESGAAASQALANGLASGEGGISSQASETAANAAGAFGSSFESAFGGIDDQVNSMIEETMESAAATTESNASSLEGAMESASEALESGAATVPTAVAEATTSASEALATLTTDLSASGDEIVTVFTEISTQIATSTTEISTAMTAMASDSQDSMMSIVTIVAASITIMQSAVATGTSEMQETVQATVTAVRALTTTGMAAVLVIVTAGMAALVAVVASACSQIVGLAQGAASGIRSAFESIDLSSTGAQMMNGLISGMESRRAEVLATAQSIAAAGAQAANAGAQVKSPSRITTKTGRFIGEGLVVGMASMKNAVQNAASKSLVQPIINRTDSLETSGATQSRSGIFGDMLGGFGTRKNGGQSESGSEPTFVFSPTYHFEGEAPSKQDIVEANRMSQAEFEKMMKEYMRKNKRVSFA